MCCMSAKCGPYAAKCNPYVAKRSPRAAKCYAYAAKCDLYLLLSSFQLGARVPSHATLSNLSLTSYSTR